MSNIKFRKQKISIQLIGKERFWTGLIVGVGTAVFIAYLLNVFYETFRILELTSTRSIAPPAKKSFLSKYFIGLLSSVLGQAICIWLWMQNPRDLSSRKRFYAQVAGFQSLTVFWLFLWLIADTWKIFFDLSVMDAVELSNQFKTSFLFVNVLFLNSWYLVRRVYKSTKWMAFSLIGCLLFGLFLSMATSYDKKTLIDNY